MYARGANGDVCLYIVKRTQIYLDEKQAARLDKRAAEGGTTRSGVIREAIDAYLTPDGDEWRVRWKGALRATGGIAPYLPNDHVESMRAAGARKLTEVERRASE